ncbi:hypothetical protein [Alicyclobacillus sp. SO9]|uniref:hypothetical protein n=1 Tax=Alicyclobacillus sp. SO9 TaxID=2665646 RepID=UPI0018E8FC65|nr:hypothetical protein [Alicyclobacillus sp. SO9]QQE80975.1 hypothetical protein GI364_11690 [Alicyclobacillus sp. SO9]
MSGVWLEWIRPCVALFLMGLTVKLIDDGLDRDYDKARGHISIAVKLGRGLSAYTALTALVAAWMNLSIALAVFFGSYAAGMFKDWREPLPTRVPAWVEIVIVAILAVVMLNWQLAVWGIAMMSTIDWLDDVMDAARDEKTGQFNLANKFGLIEALILILIALSVAVFTNVKLTALTLITLPFVDWVAQALSSVERGGNR